MNETPLDGVTVCNTAQQGLLLAVSALGLAFGVILVLAGAAAVLPGCLTVIVAVLLGWRSANARVEATMDSVTIRNFWRTYTLAWGDISGLDTDRNSNVTGLVHCLVVHRREAEPIEATGTASYSRRKVTAMKAELDRLRP